MTKREVGSLAFKLAGIYALVRAADHATYLFMWAQSVMDVLRHRDGVGPHVTELWTGLLVALPFAFLVALGVFLIARGGWLSARMFPGPEQDVTVTASARDVQAIAFSVVGVLLIASALPMLAQIGVNLYYHYKYPEMELRVIRGNWVAFLRMCAKLILGTVLFFSGRSLSNLWFRMRTFRQPPRVDESAAGES